MDIQNTTGQSTRRFSTKSELAARINKALNNIGTPAETTSNHKGLFIAFEGGEGSGKSTQAKMLDQMLRRLGINVVLTREPGGTDAGRTIRRLLLELKGMELTKKAELLLFLADRAQHVETVIEPALERGAVVICDRYAGSTLAYQCYAGGLDLTFVKSASAWAASCIKPDVTYFLDIAADWGLERARANKPNRFEKKDLAYHEAVRAGFETIADDDKSWQTIWTADDEKRVHGLIATHAMGLVEQMLLSKPKKSEPMPVHCPYCDSEMAREHPLYLKYRCPKGHGKFVFETDV